MVKIPEYCEKILKISIYVSHLIKKQRIFLKFNKNVFLTGNIKLIGKNLLEVKKI